MSTGAIPKRPRRRKIKAKLSFGSSSGGTSGLPCHLKANLTELIALLETPQKGQGDELRPGLMRDAIEEAGTSPAATISDSYETQRSSKPADGHSKASSSAVVDHQRSYAGDDEAVRMAKPEPRALTELDESDIVRQLREVLQKKGPSQEDDLLGAVSPSQAELVLEVYGTMTAFLDKRPGFNVVHEDLYSFVYYEDPDGELQSGSSSHTKKENTSGSSGSNSGGRQNAVDWEGVPDRACSTSSSKPAHDSAFLGERHEVQGEEEKQVLKNAGNQVLSSSQSGAVQTVRKASDAESQTQRCDVSRIVESMPTPKNQGADVAPPKGKMKTLGQSPEKPQPPRANSAMLHHASPPELPRRSAELKNSTIVKEMKHNYTNGAITKTKIEEKLSRIVRMVKKRQPDIAEQDIRKQIDDSRKSLGGLSGMTFNDIVALVLGRLGAVPENMEDRVDSASKKKTLS
ncbi:hypothetical protein HPB52_001265 [Rhipicephalus sanguineus]|uniref:Uncharacterized protein n=1 Tax=Rhipicephalus sanguineus TaxID=34632 RepID=A0A9D4QG73_RHISA|nr:hypothetical protein HPB52_001265 [Rhipicephalus sanguineus]